MKREETIAMFDAINRTGIDNSEWGVCEDVNTQDYFDAIESINLSGAWIYIFFNEDNELPLDYYLSFRTGRPLPSPDYSIRLVSTHDFQYVALYKL